MFIIHNNELAEKTIDANDVFISFIISHFSKIKMLTEPLTAISVMVMNGMTIIIRYVKDIGIIDWIYVSGMLNAQIKMTNWNV